MIEIIKFIFSSFWVWSGTVVLIAILGASVSSALTAAAATLKGLLK